MPVLPSTNGAARVCYNLCRSEGDIWQCRDILCLQGSESEFDQEFLWLQKRTFLVSAGSPAAINQPRSQSSHSRPTARRRIDETPAAPKKRITLPYWLHDRRQHWRNHRRADLSGGGRGIDRGVGRIFKRQSLSLKMNSLLRPRR